MARRAAHPEPLLRPGALELPELRRAPDRAALFAVLGLMSRPAPSCTIEEHVAAAHRAAQVEAEGLADAMAEVLDAVLGGLELTPQKWERGNAIAVAELRRLAGQNR
jgi:hypothetical protein